MNYEELARCTDDFNGAQCKAVCVEAVSGSTWRGDCFMLSCPPSLNRMGLVTAGDCWVREAQKAEALESWVTGAGRHPRACLSWVQGMIALRRGATELTHEDYMEGILEVQAKKKANLQYYA